MKKFLEFKRVNICAGSKYPLYVYESKYFGLKYDVVKIRITKDRNNKWTIRTRTAAVCTFTIWSSNIKSLKEAKFEANAKLNARYNFSTDFDDAFDHYKL